MLHSKFLRGVLLLTVIRASVPKLNLDDVFEQKNDIAKSVEEELEKVIDLFIQYYISVRQISQMTSSFLI